MNRNLICVGVALLLLACSSCAIVGGGAVNEGGTGTLGQAVVAARDTSGKVLRVNAGHHVRHEGDGFETDEMLAASLANTPGDSGPAAPDTGRAGDVHLRPDRVGIVGGGGSLGGATYDGFGFGGLKIGYDLNRWRMDLTGGAAAVNFSAPGALGAAFRDPTDLYLDVTAGYDFAPHAIMDLRPIAGVRFGTLFWDYARPVALQVGHRTQTVDSDDINHFSLFGGAGLTVMRLRHVEIEANLTGGVRFYGGHSNEGLRNDQFPTTGFAQTEVAALYHF
jgi:hypothetical protein